MNTLSNYKGHWDEFDYFFNIDEFDSNNFNPDWLLYYSDKVLSYICSKDAQLNVAKSGLRQMDKSNCKEHTERWLYLHSIVI